MMIKRVGQNWQAQWDSQTGRYRGMSFFVGDVYDPATGKNVQDCELILIGAAAQLPWTARNRQTRRASWPSSRPTRPRPKRK